MAGDRPHNFKTKQLNTRHITFERSHFRKLAAACAKAMTGMSNWHPSSGKPAELRGHFEDLYAFMATHMRDEFGNYDFDVRLMSGAKISHCDFVQGELDVQLNYLWQGQVVRFELKCANDNAPYSTDWVRKEKRFGADTTSFENGMSCV